MSRDLKDHIGKERILTAFIDRADLSPSEREHLQHCPACEYEIQALDGQLRRLSDEARRYTPEMKVKIALPEPETHTWWGWAGKWIGAPVLAAACVALILVFFQPQLVSNPRPYGDVSLAVEKAADARLMAEISDIEEGVVSTPVDDATPTPIINADEDYLDDIIPDDVGV